MASARPHPVARLTLARWEDYDGSSQGYWLVRELAGLCLRRREDPLPGERAGWEVWPLHLLAGESDAHDQFFWERTWGAGWQPDPRLLLAVAAWNRVYPSRRAALLAVETALLDRLPRRALSEALA